MQEKYEKPCHGLSFRFKWKFTPRSQIYQFMIETGKAVFRCKKIELFHGRLISKRKFRKVQFKAWRKSLTFWHKAENRNVYFSTVAEKKGWKSRNLSKFRLRLCAFYTLDSDFCNFFDFFAKNREFIFITE